MTWRCSDHLRLLLLAAACLCSRALLNATANRELAELLLSRLEQAPRRPPYTLAVCTMIHNERPYLAEWLLYHFALGVQHFVLYDNESSDGTTALLQPFIDRGLVTLVPWPGRARQRQQIDACFQRESGLARWLACFDVDEFVVDVAAVATREALLGTPRLHAFLRGFENDRLAALLLDRMDFDADGHDQRIAGLVTAEFRSRWVQQQVSPVVGKLVVLLASLERMLGAHDAQLVGPEFGVWDKATADRERFSKALPLRHARHEPLRLNHYVSRSYAECTAKLTLGRWEGSMDWRKRNGQAMCDRNMVGQPGYAPEQHTRESGLAESGFPALVEEMMRLMEARCNCSLR
jgi:hypothetical protein